MVREEEDVPWAPKTRLQHGRKKRGQSLIHPLTLSLSLSLSHSLSHSLPWYLEALLQPSLPFLSDSRSRRSWQHQSHSHSSSSDSDSSTSSRGRGTKRARTEWPERGGRPVGSAAGGEGGGGGLAGERRRRCKDYDGRYWYCTCTGVVDGSYTPYLLSLLLVLPSLSLLSLLVLPSLSLPSFFVSDSSQRKDSVC